MSAVDGIDEFAAQLAGILKEKNAAYGDSFARVPTILAMLYPGVQPEVLENILFTARILDKLGRIAQDPLAAGEDAYLDVAGYAMMMANWQRLKRAAKVATVKEPKADVPRAGVMFVGDEAVHYDMPAEAPSEPKAAFEPVVAPADCNRTERWLIRRNADGKLLQWVFTTREAAGRFIANYVTGDLASALRAAVDVPSEPNGRIKRDMANAEVTQEPTGWYIVCFEGRDRQFFNDFGGFWTHDIRDATSFLSQEAVELCLRRREGSPVGEQIPRAIAAVEDAVLFKGSRRGRCAEGRPETGKLGASCE